MKKHNLRIIIFSLIIGFLMPMHISANKSIPDVVLSMQLGSENMYINGVKSAIDGSNGTKPLLSDNRVLVPIRAIIEAFGGSVSWNDKSKTATLSLAGDCVKLTVNSKTAYHNDQKHTLDVSPTISNNRTMLPIRFIAESFNLGVAWDGNTKTVTVIHDSFTQEEYNTLMSMLTPYSGSGVLAVNQNKPFFKSYEIISGSFEYYSTLDKLGRCDVCEASIAQDLMPAGKRGDISSVKPTGWINKKYDIVSGGYLYNRCHLIGYQLTGENANPRNLITGTRFLNTEGMLPYENKVDNYIERTGNHVMYRVTPVFADNNLVADGVLMEGYSVEDNGKGISFCVYCYNVQPGISINYLTGDSFLQ